MARKERGVNVEGAVSREGKGPVGKDEAVGSDDDGVGAEGLQFRSGLGGGKGGRLKDGESQGIRENLDGGLGGLFPPAGGAVRLGVNTHDLRSAVGEGLEGWGRRSGGCP